MKKHKKAVIYRMRSIFVTVKGLSWFGQRFGHKPLCFNNNLHRLRPHCNYSSLDRSSELRFRESEPVQKSVKLLPSTAKRNVPLTDSRVISGSSGPVNVTSFSADFFTVAAISKSVRTSRKRR
jgi:hypothetical protein